MAIVTKIQEMLDCCLDVGFKSAASDGCHLLYSTTWSALGASPAWYEVSPSISMNPEDLFHGPLSALLSEIRNDVCLITLKAKRQEGPVSTNPMVDRNMDSASACSFEKKKKYGVDYTLLCNNCTPSFHCSTHDARYRASWEWKGPGAQRRVGNGKVREPRDGPAHFIFKWQRYRKNCIVNTRRSRLLRRGTPSRGRMYKRTCSKRMPMVS